MSAALPVTLEAKATPPLHLPDDGPERGGRLADEGKFGENGPIDQAATDRWASERQEEYRLAWLARACECRSGLG